MPRKFQARFLQSLHPSLYRMCHKQAGGTPYRKCERRQKRIDQTRSSCDEIACNAVAYRIDKGKTGDDLHEHADDDDGRMKGDRRNAENIRHNRSGRTRTQRNKKIIDRAFSEKTDRCTEDTADNERAQRIEYGSAEKQRKEKRAERGGCDDKGCRILFRIADMCDAPLDKRSVQNAFSPLESARQTVDHRQFIEIDIALVYAFEIRIMLSLFVEKRNHNDRRCYKRRRLDRAESRSRPHNRFFRTISFPAVFKYDRSCGGSDLLYVVHIDAIHNADYSRVPAVCI